MPDDTEKNGELSRAVAAHHAGIDHQFETQGLTLGAPTSYSILRDPKHLAFVLARYKFVAKMLEGRERVLEIGCGDGIGMPIVAQVTNSLHLVDWEKRQVENVSERWGSYFESVSFQAHNILEGPLSEKFDAVYAVDVIEHIDPKDEALFWEGIIGSLKPNGVCLVGTPNLSAEHLAGPDSKIAHINLKSHAALRKSAEQYFNNVFMFGMNDEVVHTGHPEMAHYIWALGVAHGGGE
jgi:2-polyprenyl-3-methyl-5-hydroxy-6-metoxy-1,4-benzoquinol methylase